MSLLLLYKHVSNHQTVHLKLTSVIWKLYFNKAGWTIKNKNGMGYVSTLSVYQRSSSRLFASCLSPIETREEIPVRTQMNSLATSLRKPFCEKMPVELTVFPDVADLHSIAHLCGQLTSMSQTGTVRRTRVALIIIFICHPLDPGFLSQTPLKPNS